MKEKPPEPSDYQQVVHKLMIVLPHARIRDRLCEEAVGLKPKTLFPVFQNRDASMSMKKKSAPYS
jgi:hypothetical protein